MAGEVLAVILVSPVAVPGLLCLPCHTLARRPRAHVPYPPPSGVSPVWVTDDEPSPRRLAGRAWGPQCLLPSLMGSPLAWTPKQWNHFVSFRTPTLNFHYRGGVWKQPPGHPAPACRGLDTPQPPLLNRPTDERNSQDRPQCGSQSYCAALRNAPVGFLWDLFTRSLERRFRRTHC